MSKTPRTDMAWENSKTRCHPDQWMRNKCEELERELLVMGENLTHAQVHIASLERALAAREKELGEARAEVARLTRKLEGEGHKGLYDKCVSFRHDFGLLSFDEQTKIRDEVIRKEAGEGER